MIQSPTTIRNNNIYVKCIENKKYINRIILRDETRGEFLMTARKAISYCNSLDCPFDNCKLHRRQAEISIKDALVMNYEMDCRKYLNWLAYSNYSKYAELKEHLNKE